MQEKRSSSLSVKETGRDWGNISDHRTYHTPLRNTWKPGGQRGLKMNWIGAKRVKNHIKARKKFEIGLRVQEAPGSNPGTPTMTSVLIAFEKL